MFGTIASIILNLLAKVGWGFWKEHKKNEAQNAANKANSLSDDAVVSELRTKWQRPDQ